MSPETDISLRRAKLSAAKKTLLEKRLRGEIDQISKKHIIPPRSDADLSPLSFAQERLWFLDQLDPDSPAYNRPLAFRLTGRLNINALQQTLGKILQRHEVLRTAFPTLDGQPSQTVTPFRSQNLPVLDLSDHPTKEREARMMRLATTEARKPFNLAKGPLLKARLLRLSEYEHVLLLVIHHIVFDGWSARIFTEELAEIYQALSKGRPSPLPEPLIQYADFAAWQRRQLAGDVLEQHLSYWKSRLSASPPTLDLPTDRPRPAVQTSLGSHHILLIQPSLCESLKRLGRQYEATFFMTLFAAYAVLLHRYSGQEDILVGTPFAGRPQVELEKLIGFFVNIVVLRTDLSGEPSFVELLSRVRKVVLESYDHQLLPFEKLVEELQPKRDLSRTPLFQVMFNLENLPVRDLLIKDLSIRELVLDSFAAPFELTLEITEMDEGLSCLFNYNTDLFEKSTIERMAGHFQTLLQGIATDPGQRISELPLLTSAESHRLLVEWNDTKTDYTRGKCIHEQFETRAKLTPEATALVYEDRQMSYGELNRRSNQLARHLQSLGVGPEVLVGILMKRSPEVVVGLLGILKAGGAYVPLDPMYPEERIAYMLEDSQAAVLLSESELVEKLPADRTKKICIDRDWHTISQNLSENLNSGARPDNLAYVMYTSGSTGAPKGVMIEHDNLVNFFTGMDLAVGHDPPGTWLAVTTISFDISVLELFWTLARGFKVVLFDFTFTVPDNTKFAPETTRHKQAKRPTAKNYSIAELIERENVSHLQCTPPMCQMLMSYPDSRKSLQKLKTLLLGGEALPLTLLKQLRELFSGQIFNMYGPTETTIWSTVYPFNVPDTNNHTVSIGQPIANTEVYLLDRNLQPLPVGVFGEIFIGGSGVGRGYLNRPELTAEKFIPHPFSDDPAARLYKTGDLARYLPNGNIEFMGRIDHQIKIRGYRIEPGEIETVLAEHSEVKTAVVTVREDQPGDRRLTAYVVPKAVSTPGAQHLRRFLNRKLPDYMIPSAFVFLDSLPLTPNGKVDRLKLPAPDQNRPVLEETFTAPRTPVEKKLAEIWARILGLTQVGIKDNFFDLGGHSLLAVRLFNSIEQAIGRRLPLATLFKAPTVEQLAHILTDDGWQAPWSSLVEIQTGGSKRPLFLVHGAGGNVLFYRSLAIHLGPEQPVYGLQSKGLDGLQPFHTRIEKMASDYAKAIKRVQPKGPYLLGGYCLGGSIALEIASQFRSRADEVALLAMFETYNLANIGAQSIFAKMYFYIQKLMFHWQNLQMLSAKDKFTFIKEKLSVAKQRKMVWYGMAASNFIKKSRSSFGKAQHLYELWINNDRAAKDYIPKIYPGQIVHFRPIKEYAKFATPKALWEEVAADGVKTFRLPVYPAGMFTEPFVEILAVKLKEILAESNHGH